MSAKGHRELTAARGERPAGRGAAAAALLALAAAPVAAQVEELDAVRPGAVALDTVVVTAAGFEQNVADAPASVTVITREELETGVFRDLTDALEEVQGVAVTGSANEEDIHIRGLPGAYTLILVDGKRQNTRDARTNGSAGFEQSFVPPLDAIERIEIVRGPMSALYGSDAMGGVINIITRPVADEIEGQVSVEGTLQQHDEFGHSAQAAGYVSVPLLDDTLGLQAWGRAYIREQDAFVGGITGAKEGDLAARLSFEPGDDQIFRLEGGFTRLRREADAGKVREEGEEDSRQDHDRWRWSLSHTGYWDEIITDVSILQEWAERTMFARAAGEDGFIENPRSPLIRNTVADAKVTAPFQAFGEHVLVGGGQWFNAWLEDQNPGRRTGGDETFEIDQWALFAEDEWALTDAFALTAGLRYDHHEVYGGQFSPRAYGVWRPIDPLTIKGGVSTGFRAPDIRQIAPGYAYTTGGRGCTYGPEGTCGVIIADPELEAEKSTSYEIGALWDGFDGFSAGATFFWTEFEDKITNALVLDEDGEPVRWAEDPGYRLWYNYNIDEARIRGVELAASWEATETLSFRGTYTYTDSEQKTGDYAGFPLARTPEHAANLRVDWLTPVDGLLAFGSVTYHGREFVAGPRLGDAGDPVTINGVEGREYDDYPTVEVGASYFLTDAVRVSGSVYNLFDKNIDPDDYNTVGEGRRFWLSLTKTF